MRTTRQQLRGTSTLDERRVRQRGEVSHVTCVVHGLRASILCLEGARLVRREFASLVMQGVLVMNRADQRWHKTTRDGPTVVKT